MKLNQTFIYFVNIYINYKQSVIVIDSLKYIIT